MDGDNSNNANGGSGETGEKSLFETLEHVPEGEISTISPEPLDLGKAIYPDHSILADWMDLVSQYAESANCYLIGSILPVVGAILGRSVYYDLDRRKYPNLFCMLTGKPGDRKTTAIKFAERAAERVLGPGRLTPATVSLEGLFDQYEASCGGNPDQLLIADDANSILANWSESGYGKVVAKKYLELYDCGKLEEAFRKNQKSGEGAFSIRRIEETSTGILFGATFNICRFNKLETRDGMSRRFLYYVADQTSRFIPNPPPFDSHAFADLLLKFEDMKKLDGPMRLSESSEPIWEAFQREIWDTKNRSAMTSENAAYLSTLSEAPSHVLKVAMIFQVCSHVKNPTHRWDEIRGSTMETAIAHVMHSVASARALDSISERTRIQEEAETIYAQIQCRFQGSRDEDVIFLSRSQITGTFAKNSQRPNSMKPGRIYSQLVPYMVRQGKCKVVQLNGVRKYAFWVGGE